MDHDHVSLEAQAGQQLVVAERALAKAPQQRRTAAEEWQVFDALRLVELGPLHARHLAAAVGARGRGRQLCELVLHERELEAAQLRLLLLLGERQQPRGLPRLRFAAVAHAPLAREARGQRRRRQRQEPQPQHGAGRATLGVTRGDWRVSPY